MKRNSTLLQVLLSLFLCATTAMPCTTFVLKGKGRVYFGRNLDWFWEDGIVVVNPRDLRKTAFLMSEKTPVTWTARFGSVTFNQFGRELPFGGMNEAGLVVENMVLEETQYAEPDSRPAITLLQWIQYQLDNCRTVAEVLATDQKVRIETPPASVRGLARIHYLVCDATGDCAVIEILNGKLTVRHGERLACPALANSTYEDSMAYLLEHPLPVQPAPRAADRSSPARFAQAAARAAAWQPGETPRQDLDYAFDTLDQVNQGGFTVWRIVYDVTARQIHFRTRSNMSERTLDLHSLDFAASRPARFVSLQARPDAAGVLPFEELTEARHRQYLGTFFAREDLKQRLGDLSQLGEGLMLTLQSYACAPSSSSAAAEPAKVIELWPGAVPGEKETLGEEKDTTKPTDRPVAGKPVIRLGNVSKPTIAIYPPKDARPDSPAVLVCPGGGYSILAMDLEGTEVCEWLNSLGVTGVLLKYRVPKRAGLEKHTAALQDAQRALGMVRHQAKDLGINPGKIGVLGFSAGGHLAALLSNQYEQRSYTQVDDVDAASCRPDFSVLIYPAYLTVKEQNDALAPEFNLTSNTPPTFIAMAEDDPIRVETAFFYALGLRKAKVPFELHVYPTGGHGYGLRPAKPLVTTWPQRAADWMRSLGVVEAGK